MSRSVACQRVVFSLECRIEPPDEVSNEVSDAHPASLTVEPDDASADTFEPLIPLISAVAPDDASIESLPAVTPDIFAELPDETSTDTFGALISVNFAPAPDDVSMSISLVADKDPATISSDPELASHEDRAGPVIFTLISIPFALNELLR